MNHLAFLDELLVMVNTGEINTVEGKNDSIEMLQNIKMIVRRELCNEVVRDVTDARTEYFAPEYESWKTFLSDCNGDADYEQVLEDSFTEEELEILWQSSHITEELTEEQVKEDILLQIGQLKMLEIVNRKHKARNPIKALEMTAEIKARLQGLYNMLYET